MGKKWPKNGEKIGFGSFSHLFAIFGPFFPHFGPRAIFYFFGRFFPIFGFRPVLHSIPRRPDSQELSYKHIRIHICENILRRPIPVYAGKRYNVANWRSQRETVHFFGANGSFWHFGAAEIRRDFCEFNANTYIYVKRHCWEFKLHIFPFGRY